MKTVVKYLKEYYGKICLGLIIKIIGTLSELMIPYVLSYILSDVINRKLDDILFWGGLMIVFSIIACVFNVIANRMSAKVSKDFAQSLRKDLFIRTLNLSAKQTDDFTIPSLESRITTDTYNVHNFINMLQRMGVRAPIMLIGGIAITLFMDAKLSLVMIALTPILFFTIYFIRQKGIPLYTKVQSAVDNMIKVVREDMQGIRVIKALSKTDYEHKRYEEVNNNLSNIEVTSGIIIGAVNPVMNVFINLGSVGVIALGATFVSRGTSSPETIIAFMQYFMHISMALMAVTRMFVMYSKCSASANRIEEVLETSYDITIKDKKDYPDILTNAHITFDNVSFSYNSKKNNLSDISFELKKGGHIGIIGATGSGKSTIAKLLLRFYDTTSGEIYINGENIKTIPQDKLYSMFGSAMQNDFLYSDTIMENIKFGREIDEEDIIKAAKTAQAHDFILEFKDGYNHILSSRATNISGGQKQRILIARALAKMPKILILDDCSSALDYKTDLLLRRALSKSFGDTTVVTIAQRVSTIKDCDIILVLDKGRIIGKGTHEELLNSCTHYREISDSQMGGAFIE